MYVFFVIHCFAQHKIDSHNFTLTWMWMDVKHLHLTQNTNKFHYEICFYMECKSKTICTHNSKNISILYIKATVFVCVGSGWKILPIIARSLSSFPRCNFPRCNWLQRKKKSGVVWFFEAKDLVDQKKIFRPWTDQNHFFFFFFFVLTKTTFFFF